VVAVRAGANPPGQRVAGAQPGQWRLIYMLVNPKLIVRGDVEQNKHFPLLKTREPW
jgi:hypothetical protein